MTKTSLILLSALALSGCGAVDELINETLSGDVTTETITAKDKVLIIYNVSRTACVVIKNGLISQDNLNSAETLVTEPDVTCATYGKITGTLTDPNASCIEQSLESWLDTANNGDIISVSDALGDQACVIGSDL